MQRPISPAQQHQKRFLAMMASGKSESGTVTTGSHYELMLYQLAQDRRRLKQLQSIKSKGALKKQLLPSYQAWIDGVLAGGKGAQDDVFTNLLVWHIDTGEFDRALTMARYALQHKMTLPDHYNRDVPTMLIDEFSAAYFNGALAENPAYAVQVLETVAELTEPHDTPDQARAKLYKALAFAQLVSVGAEDDSQDKSALFNLQKALSLHPHVGVKKEIERLERRIKKTEQTQRAPSAHGGAG